LGPDVEVPGEEEGIPKDRRKKNGGGEKRRYSLGHPSEEKGTISSAAKEAEGNIGVSQAHRKKHKKKKGK